MGADTDESRHKHREWAQTIQAEWTHIDLIWQRPLAERQTAGGHRVTERHRVGRKTQLDKNAVYTNNEIGHKDKHGRIQSGGNKNVSGSKVTHKERERVA